MTLTLKHLTASYRAVPVIRGVSDHWQPGQVTALIGCNGAGKSTLLKAIAGLHPMGGEITMAQDPMPVTRLRRCVAYMPQDTTASTSLTMLEVVLLGRLGTLGMRIPQDLITEALAALDTFGLASLHTRTLDALSGGQRQLVYLAQALFRAPDVLLLDEPTAALDLRHQLLVLEQVRSFAQNTGTVVVIAMHDLTLAAQFSDRLVGLHQGKVAAAGPAQMVLTPDFLEELYGIQADVEITPSGRLWVTPLRATIN